jgi:hypothetical protein
VLHGLQQQGYRFELKGGTSLSKGYGIIDRFGPMTSVVGNSFDIIKISENRLIQ